MWAVKNETPYAAERNWTRDKDGAHVWIVAVKATFTIAQNGALKLADEQTPPVLEPVYRGEDPATSSLKYDSDLLAVKPNTDVVVNGQAHAPGGRPATQVDVLLRMPHFSKHLIVYGYRTYFAGVLGLTTTPPNPFTSAPICYEDAFGGADLEDKDPKRQRMDRRNPVGKGVAAASANLVHKPAHRIEYSGGDASGAGPAGFGPIASSWSPRVEMGGTYDEAWDKQKKPLLPDDYDPRAALSAPLDQRPQQYLQGGELVEMLNMTPDGGLRFQLPRLDFTYSTRFGTRSEEHTGQLVTVIVEPDDRKLMVVYQTSLRVGRKDVAYLDETIISGRG